MKDSKENAPQNMESLMSCRAKVPVCKLIAHPHVIEYKIKRAHIKRKSNFAFPAKIEVIEILVAIDKKNCFADCTSCNKNKHKDCEHMVWKTPQEAHKLIKEIKDKKRRKRRRRKFYQNGNNGNNNGNNNQRLTSCKDKQQTLERKEKKPKKKFVRPIRFSY